MGVVLLLVLSCLVWLNPVATEGGEALTKKTLGGGIPTRSYSPENDDDDDGDGDGSREALRILKWADKRGLGPFAITPNMIRQRRSSGGPLTLREAPEVTSPECKAVTMRVCSLRLPSKGVVLFPAPQGQRQGHGKFITDPI